MPMRLLLNASQALSRLSFKSHRLGGNVRESAWFASGSPDSPKEFGYEVGVEG
ncbi:MAG: hypothetical protein JWP89_6919 [Schlesneria sp.]|nr:hypothetical protein [Schlesneria sp.]